MSAAAVGQALGEDDELAEAAGRMIAAILTSESREIREVVLDESVVVQVRCRWRSCYAPSDESDGAGST